MLNHPISRAFWIIFAVITVTLALALTSARMLFPAVEKYQQDVEGWAGALLGQPVRIGEFDAQWRGLGPEIIFTDVQFLDKKAEKVILEVEEVRIGIDPINSLLRQRAEFDRLDVTIPSLSLRRRSDGGISLSGFNMEVKEPQDDSGDLLAQWLFRQDHLGLVAHHVYWVDEINNEKQDFTGVSLKLYNSGKRHKLEGMINLPEAMGDSVYLIMDIEGDLLAPAGWDGEVYAQANAVQMGYWLDGLTFQESEVQSGIGDFEIWMQWNSARLDRLEGTVVASSLMIENKEQKKELSVDRLLGWVDWSQRQDGWHFAMNNFTVDVAGSAWPEGWFHIDHQRKENDVGLSYDVKLGYLRLQQFHQISSFLTLPEKISQLIGELKPKGIVKDMHAIYDNEAGEISYLAHGNFEGVTTKSWRRLPGMKDVAGSIYLSDKQGKLVFTTKDTDIDLPYLFRWPLSALNIEGELRWENDADGWYVRSDSLIARNRDLSTKTNLDLYIPHDKSSPYLDIIVDFENGDASKTSRYLPTGIMSKGVVDWLDQSIVNGRIKQGRMVWHGRTKDFPYDDGKGRFEVSFNTKDAVIKPATGWSDIDKINADVSFFHRAMSINATSGRIYSSPIKWAKIDINDMRSKPVELLVDGEVSGPTSEKIRYMLESPLREAFEGSLGILEAEGDSDLSLQLLLGISPGSETHVNGSIVFKDNQLNIKPVDLDVNHLNGMLDFTEATMFASGVSGEVFGWPMNMTINTVEQEVGPVILMDAKGEVGTEGLSYYLDPPLLKQITGSTPWEASLYIPRINLGGGPSATLRVESFLYGMGIDLPEPIGKKTEEARKLVVRSQFYAKNPVSVIVDYGDQVNGIFEISETPKLRMFDRGELKIGGQTAVLPPQQGITVSGSVPSYSYSEWDQIFVDVEESEIDEDVEPLLSLINKLDVDVGKFEILDQHFENGIHISATKLNDAWSTEVDSPEIKGGIYIPADTSIRPLEMVLDYWHMTKMPQDPVAGDVSDPQALPVLQITSKQFSFDGIDLGALKLSTYPGKDGYYVDLLELSPPNAKISMKGKWRTDARGHHTSLDARLDTNNAGNTLSGLGFAGSIKEGEGYMLVKAGWPGMPMDFDRAHVSGNFDMDIADGRLIDIDPGAGRIFGLLSLQALPRRLSLDFSDIFQTGLSFDRVKGVFDISDGKGKIKEFFLEGPAADIVVTGNVDLGNREYDQHVTVTPHVTENLPVWGALAAGPEVGAVLLFVQKLFKKQIDKLAGYQYTITGPWEAPEINKLEEEISVQESTSELFGEKP